MSHVYDDYNLFSDSESAYNKYLVSRGSHLLREYYETYILNAVKIVVLTALAVTTSGDPDIETVLPKAWHSAVSNIQVEV